MKQSATDLNAAVQEASYPCSGYDQQTGMFQQQPGILQQQPGMFQQQPGMFQQQPGMFQQQPGMYQQFQPYQTMPQFQQQLAPFQQMPFFPQQPISPPTPSGSLIPGIQVPGQVFVEESFVENILRDNLGKVATIYMTFENNTQWNAKVFKGVLEAAGRDHIIISDPQTGRRYLLLMVNLDYITFDEPLIYTRPPLPPGVL